MNSEIIDTSIAIELAVADIYLLFHTSYPEDSDFWWKMSIEEKGHAALLRSGRDSFMPLKKFPKELVTTSLNKLKNSLQFITEKSNEIKENPISRKEAFDLAVYIEESIGELHYQEFMAQSQDVAVNNVFQKLNGADKDHRDRILSYMKEKGIK